MKLLSLIAAIALSTSAMAQNTTQTVIIDGMQTDKAVTEITFSGNDATLLFTDGTSQTVEASKVNISLNYVSAGISGIKADSNNQNSKCYNIGGQQVTEEYNGITIKDGKKTVSK